MTEASHIAEFVRAKLAAGNLPVLQSFAPTVTITSTPEHMNELDTGQRALAEALQALQAEWQRSMQQVAADARAAALAELPANMDRTPQAEPRERGAASEEGWAGCQGRHHWARRHNLPTVRGQGQRRLR